MRFLRPQMIADAINDLGSPFDAHSVEMRLLRLYTVETAAEILRCGNARDVLQTFSAQLARFIDQSFQGQIRKTTKVRTANLGGRPCANQQWEKLVDRVQ